MEGLDGLAGEVVTATTPKICEVGLIFEPELIRWRLVKAHRLYSQLETDCAHCMGSITDLLSVVQVKAHLYPNTAKTGFTLHHL